MTNSTSDKRLSIMDSLVKWKETYELSFELAEISYILLNKLADYCEKHDIPLYEEQGMLNLVKRAGHIFKLIERINSPDFKSPKLPPFNFDDENPDKLPDSAFLEEKEGKRGK